MVTGNAEKLRAALDRAYLTAKRREQRVFGLALAAAVLAATAGLAMFGQWTRPVLAAWALRGALLLLVTAAVAAWRLRRPARLFASARLAQVIGLSREGLRSATDSAAEFVAWEHRQAIGAAPRKQRRSVSLELIGAHLETTANALEPRVTDAKLKAHYADFDKRVRLACAGAVLLSLVAAVATPGAQSALLRGLWSPGEADLSDLPLVGDLSITLRYPAYTGLPPRELQGGDGTIRALKGSSVLLRARADSSVRAAELQLGEADAGATVVPLAVEGGRQLSGELLLERSGRYRFVLKPLLGADVKERRGHPLIVDEDKYPSVEIREPAQDLELRDTGRLVIGYSADDDFAVSELALEYRVGAQAPQRIVLPPPAAKTKIRGDYAFDLSTLNLNPGDVVSLLLEVKDNDTVSGPKKTRSRERRVTVYSSEQHRRQLLQRLTALVDKMVDQLADELENPLSAQADTGAYTTKALPADDRGLALAAELADIGRGLRETDGGDSKFSLSANRTSVELKQSYTAKRAADQGLQRGRSAPLVTAAMARQADAVALLERTVVYFEDLRALATLDAMKAQAKELSATQQQLRSLLEQYKETGDENLRKALEAEMAALKQRIAEIMQKMAELQKGLPQEFVNREAFERRNMENVFDKMDQALAENRLDDLQTELDRLQAQIDNMQRTMDDAEQQYGGDRYAELRRELQEFKQNLESVEAAQQDVHDKTQEAEQKYREAAQRQLGQKLDDVVKQSVKDLEEAQKAFDEIARRESRADSQLEQARTRTTDTKSALEQRDFLEAREMAKNAQHDARSLEQALRNLQQMEQFTGRKDQDLEAAAEQTKKAQQRINEVMKRLDKLFPDPKDVLSQKDQQQLDQLAKRQREISERARQLGEQMKGINKQAPIFDPAAQQEMDNARGAMERAGQELGQQQAGRASGSQKSALGRLQKLREQMKQQGQGQGQGGGMPMPFGGVPNPFGEGFDPKNQEKVEIPSGDAFRVPAEFRRDILDAMKQGKPEKFKQQVDEFYKELIK